MVTRLRNHWHSELFLKTNFMFGLGTFTFEKTANQIKCECILDVYTVKVRQHMFYNFSYS
jgi:hypothetical protein